MLGVRGSGIHRVDSGETKIDWLVWPVKCHILYIINYKYRNKYNKDQQIISQTTLRISLLLDFPVFEKHWQYSPKDICIHADCKHTVYAIVGFCKLIKGPT
jgi:hypothetical protein